MGDAPGAGFIVRPGEGRRIDLGGFNMSVKAAETDTDGAISLLEAEEPSGFGPPLHIHRDAAEAFYVFEGEYLIFLDDREWSCPAGSFIFIPARIVHRFRVGDVSSRKLNLYTPASMVAISPNLLRRRSQAKSIRTSCLRSPGGTTWTWSVQCPRSTYISGVHWASRPRHPRAGTMHLPMPIAANDFTQLYLSIGRSSRTKGRLVRRLLRDNHEIVE